VCVCLILINFLIVFFPQTISKKESNILICFVIFFPSAFYFPKFFEYRYQKFNNFLTKPVNCSKYVQAHPEIIPLTEAEFELVSNDFHLLQKYIIIK